MEDGQTLWKTWLKTFILGRKRNLVANSGFLFCADMKDLHGDGVHGFTANDFCGN